MRLYAVRDGVRILVPACSNVLAQLEEVQAMSIQDRVGFDVVTEDDRLVASISPRTFKVAAWAKPQVKARATSL